MVLLRDCKKSFMDLVALFIGQFTKLVERANDERSDGSSDASKCLVHFFRVYSSLLQKDRKEQTELFENQRKDFFGCLRDSLLELSCVYVQNRISMRF
jgi:hypothetical protein